MLGLFMDYSKTCINGHSQKDTKLIFKTDYRLMKVESKLMQNAHLAGQKYCRMLQGEHSAILLTFIKLPFVIKTFVLSIFEWPFYTVVLFVPTRNIKETK